MSMPSNFLTATETQALLAAGEITLSQVLKDHEARFEGRDSQVRAWVTTIYDKNHGPKDNTAGLPLHGVVVGVKDIINTEDLPTEYGSAIYKGLQPGIDASVVGLLKAAGAIIVGKTATAEFASGAQNIPTSNPFDFTRSPGSSSAGSAAAVSDYQCHLALGAQTGTSLTRPGGYCGIFAYKPTFGRICLDGVKSLAQTADTMGVLARSVGDLKLFARALDLYKNLPPPVIKPVNQRRFAFVKTAQYDERQEDLIDTWTKAKQILLATGAQVSELDLGEEYEGWMGKGERISLICRFEGGINLQREYVIGKSKMGKGLPEWIDNDISPQIVNEARVELANLRPRIDKLLGEYDAIVTLTTTTVAPELGKNGDPHTGSIWTALHVPMVQVPGFAGKDGMPMGLTLVGARYEDHNLLEVARAVSEVWIGADEGKLRQIPAPAGAVHVKP